MTETDPSEVGQDVPDPEELIKQVVHQSFLDAGYFKDDEPEEIDKKKLRHALALAACGAAATTDTEITTNGLSRGDVMKTILPKVVQPTDQSDYVGRQVWKVLDRSLWGELNPAFSSPVQKAVGVEKPGFVLIRLTDALPRDNDYLDGVYVTDNIDLIFRDFGGPFKDKMNAMADRYAKNMRMVGQRQPQFAARVKKELEQGMGSAAKTAKNIIGALTAGDDSAE